MVAARLDIVVEQGATFELVVDLLDENGDPRTDLAGYTGAMQIREERDTTSTLLATATVAIDTVNAKATATIAKATTAGYGWSAGWYDLEITNSGATRTERIVEGRASLSRNVTA